jgi:hypothetical protein
MTDGDGRIFTSVFRLIVERFDRGFSIRRRRKTFNTPLEQERILRDG